MTHPASTNILPTVCYVDATGSHAESAAIPSTPPYTYRLGSGSPYNFPTGYQIVPPTTPGAVSVSGGGYGSWAQVTGSPAGGQFAVDTTTSPTGGYVTFSATDASKSVTINWTGSVLWNEAIVEGLWTALHDIVSAEGVASGFSMLDSNGRLKVLQANALTINGLLTTAGHILPRDVGAPSITAGPGGTGTADFSSGASFSDTSGAVTINPHGSVTVAANGVLFTLAFGTAFVSTPKVIAAVVESAGTPADLGRVIVSNPSTTGFSVISPSGLTLTNPGQIHYQVMG